MSAPGHYTPIPGTLGLAGALPINSGLAGPERAEGAAPAKRKAPDDDAAAAEGDGDTTTAPLRQDVYTPASAEIVEARRLFSSRVFA